MSHDHVGTHVDVGEHGVVLRGRPDMALPLSPGPTLAALAALASRGGIGGGPFRVRGVGEAFHLGHELAEKIRDRVELALPVVAKKYRNGQKA